MTKLNITALVKSINFFKLSTWSLIISNFSVIVFALIENFTASDILWIYWGQSVIIGVFNFLNIILLKEFSTEAFKQGGKQAVATKAVKISTAVFFLFHYGFFHFIYAIFIGGFYSYSQASTAGTDFNFVFYSIIFFLISYAIEFISSRNNPQAELPNIGKMMFAPYVRIIPMHITIVLGGFVSVFGEIFSADTNLLVIILFVMVKSFVDLVTHSINFSELAKLKKA